MQLPSILESDLYKYLTLVAVLVAILFGYRKGRDAAIVSGKSLGWTQIPLIAFAIATIGPSVFAIMAPIPFFGLIGWLSGQLIGRTASRFQRKATVQS
jgi:chromate transport protein ChrA